eukprot:Em0013g716a
MPVSTGPTYARPWQTAGKRRLTARAICASASYRPSLKPDCSAFFWKRIKGTKPATFDILGVPIGDYLFCAYFVASKCHEAQKLLAKREEIAEEFYTAVKWWLGLDISCVAVSEAVELRKHTANDAKCTELGWVSISLVVGSYGECGKEAQQCLSRLASHLAIHNCMPKSGTLCKAEHLPDEGKLQGNFL